MNAFWTVLGIVLCVAMVAALFGGQYVIAFGLAVAALIVAWIRYGRG